MHAVIIDGERIEVRRWWYGRPCSCTTELREMGDGWSCTKEIARCSAGRTAILASENVKAKKAAR